jgi:hypothetical protein
MTTGSQSRSGGDWPTLAELEPVANYIAVRLANADTSMKKVQDIVKVLQYHCVRRGAQGLRIEFGLLGGWLTRSESEFTNKGKDKRAFAVLCSILTRFADRFEELDNEAARRELHRSLTDWLAVLLWKFKAFSAKEDGQKRLIRDVRQYATNVQETTTVVAALADLPGSASLAVKCREIVALLRQETATLPYQARLAVGLSPPRRRER